MTNKVSNVSFVKPRVRVFTRSKELTLKEAHKRPIHKTWLKDRSVYVGYSTTYQNGQINYFYDLRI
jgi:23S rRNA C2498 (ribose-2'-O)-methylase RlmM